MMIAAAITIPPPIMKRRIPVPLVSGRLNRFFVLLIESVKISSLSTLFVSVVSPIVATTAPVSEPSVVAIGIVARLKVNCWNKS